jgi:hypothetical protein
MQPTAGGGRFRAVGRARSSVRPTLVGASGFLRLIGRPAALALLLVIGLATTAAFASGSQQREAGNARALRDALVAKEGPLMHPLQAAVPKGATFAGSTSQDSPVVVELSRNGKRVARIVIHWEVECGGATLPGGGVLVAASQPSSEPVSEHPYLPLSSNGSFKGTWIRAAALSTGRIVTVIQDFGGKLGSSKGAGTWDANITIVDPTSGAKVAECNTGTIRWKTPKPQALFYGGSTSQTLPVVVKLSRDLRTVRMFRIAWTAHCTPAGVYLADSFFLGDALDDFHISRRGKFGDSFSDSYTSKDGGRNKFKYELSGTVTRAKAKGTFRAQLIDTDNKGTTTATCDSAKIAWSAKQ